MKKSIVFFFVLIFGSAMAQESYLKAGLNLNLPVLMRGIPSGERYPPFTGFNFSFEKMLGKHTSFVLNLQSSRRSIYMDMDFPRSPGSMESRTIITEFNLVPEFRMYLGKSQDIPATKGQGLFLLVGVPVMKYSIIIYDYRSKYEQKWSGFDLLGTRYMGFTVPIGFGLKYPFKTGNGMELNFNTDLESLLDQDEYQTFQIGIKYFWQRKK